jgi:hypothetical protein
MKSIFTLFVTSLFLQTKGGVFETTMHSDRELRKLQISSQSVSGFTYTCDLTAKAMSFGGAQDDQIVDVIVDAKGGGEIYACGHTYST